MASSGTTQSAYSDAFHPHFSRALLTQRALQLNFSPSMCRHFVWRLITPLWDSVGLVWWFTFRNDEHVFSCWKSSKSPWRLRCCFWICARSQYAPTIGSVVSNTFTYIHRHMECWNSISEGTLYLVPEDGPFEGPGDPSRYCEGRWRWCRSQLSRRSPSKVLFRKVPGSCKHREAEVAAIKRQADEGKRSDQIQPQCMYTYFAIESWNNLISMARSPGRCS